MNAKHLVRSIMLASTFLWAAHAGAAELKISTEVFPNSLDPEEAISIEAHFIVRQVFDRLVEANPDGTVAPSLAESWSISADRSRYEFTLRKDVVFSDGSRLSAADVRNMVVQTIKKGTFRGFDRVRGASDLRNSGTPHLKGFEIIDDRRFAIALEVPDSRFLKQLLDPKCSVWKRTSGGPLLGTGPFLIADINVAKGTVKLRRNPHSQRGIAAFDEVLIQRDGSGADLYFKTPPVNEQAKLLPLRYFDTEIYFVGFNADGPGLASQAVRLALAQIARDSASAIDFEPEARRATTFIPKGMLGHDPIAKPYGGPGEVATGALSVKYYLERFAGLAEEFCRKIKSRGVACTTQRVEVSAIMDAKRDRTLQVVMARFKPTLADTEDLLAVFTKGNSVNWFTDAQGSGTLSQDLDRAFSDIQTVPVERKDVLRAKYASMDEKVRSEALVVPLAYGGEKTLWHRPEIELPAVSTLGFVGLDLVKVTKR